MPVTQAGYYDQNWNLITSAPCDAIINFTVPGYDGKNVILVQYQNGKLQHTGDFYIPMLNFQSSCPPDEGLFQWTVYDRDTHALLGNGAFTFVKSPTTVVQPTKTVYVQSAVAAATAPSVNNAQPTGTGSQVGGQMLSTVYRFILQQAGGYATGSNHEGCSQTNSAMCDPQWFPDPGGLMNAINYAVAHGEVPYQVLSTEEPWALMGGTAQIDPARIYSSNGILAGSGLFGVPWWMIAAGVGAYILLRG